LSSLVYATLLTVFGYFDSSRTVIVPVCMPPTAFNFKSRLTWIGASFLLGLLTLSVYATAHFKCGKLQKSVDRSNTQSLMKLKRLLNSLTIVVLLYTSTWFLTVCALFITQVWRKRESTHIYKEDAVLVRCMILLLSRDREILQMP
ncbi:hypothetical protein PMAYCL1PPCAC_18040, partial [Pristionchus mayeri]